MKEHPDQMVDNTLDGIEKALNGNYAFFMESATIEYTIRRHCNMTSYGGLLDSKGFGIAVRKGKYLSTYFIYHCFKLMLCYLN